MGSAVEDRVLEAQQVGLIEVPGSGKQNVPPSKTRATKDQLRQRDVMKPATARSISDAQNFGPVELAGGGIPSKLPDARHVQAMELPGNGSPIQRPNAQL